ncbi:MAG: general secretion pathway protein GspB [Desulfobacteraceae bacterium]|nr:general secretion pathway protein GspB [Desulfobacteraceae bacterium]
MSFILEALKRADRERRLERAPDLSAVYEEDDLPGHNGIRPWLWLCGSFLVGVIVVGLVLWPEGPGPVKSPLPKDETASLPSSSPNSESLQPKRPSAQASSGKLARVPVRKAKPVRPIRKVTEKIAPAKTESKPVEKTSDPKPVPTAAKISDPRPAPVAAVEKKEPVQPSPTVSPISEGSVKAAVSDKSKGGEKPVETKVVRPAGPPPAPASKEEVNRKRIEAIPLIGELPYETKEKLGKLQINVHSYSEDPAERLVFINMHSYKVGDKIGEGGPLLKEITPDGVIIDYGGGEVRLQVR